MSLLDGTVVLFTSRSSPQCALPPPMASRQSSSRVLQSPLANLPARVALLLRTASIFQLSRLGPSNSRRMAAVVAVHLSPQRSLPPSRRRDSCHLNVLLALHSRTPTGSLHCCLAQLHSSSTLAYAVVLRHPRTLSLLTESRQPSLVLPSLNTQALPRSCWLPRASNVTDPSFSATLRRTCSADAWPSLPRSGLPSVARLSRSQRPSFSRPHGVARALPTRAVPPTLSSPFCCTLPSVATIYLSRPHGVARALPTRGRPSYALLSLPLHASMRRNDLSLSAARPRALPTRGRPSHALPSETLVHHSSHDA